MLEMGFQEKVDEILKNAYTQGIYALKIVICTSNKEFEKKKLIWKFLALLVWLH